MAIIGNIPYFQTNPNKDFPQLFTQDHTAKKHTHFASLRLKVMRINVGLQFYPQLAWQYKARCISHGIARNWYTSKMGIPEIAVFQWTKISTRKSGSQILTYPNSTTKPDVCVCPRMGYPIHWRKWCSTHHFPYKKCYVKMRLQHVSC